MARRPGRPDGRTVLLGLGGGRTEPVSPNWIDFERFSGMRIPWRLLRLPVLSPLGTARLAAVAALLLTSCTGATSSAPASAPAGPPASGPIAARAAAPVGAPAAERPAWQTLPLVDARTGQSFTLADFAGKAVYVEPMATWCTNCRQQMGIIRDQLRSQLDPERAALIGLSVETELAPETLARYVDAQGFDWTFAVMTPELLQQLASTFGRTIANPPAIPHFIIGPDGTTGDLRTGLHAADKLFGELTAAGSVARP
jgi:hypothetical protein